MTAPLTITYHQAVKACACTHSLDKMRDSDIIGGDWGRFGRKRDIPLAAVLDVLGLDDLLWALHVTDIDLCRLVASDFAAHVHWVWAAWAPDDARVSASIRATRRAVRSTEASQASQASQAARAAGRVAARVAARAAWAAAWAARAHAASAAREAAWAARVGYTRAFNERAWQINHARAVITGEREPGHVPVTLYKDDADARDWLTGGRIGGAR